MRRLIFVLCLLTVGCYERRMNAWVGHSYGELIRAWGAPTTRHRRPGGGSLLTWEDAELDADSMRTCRRTFGVDRAGRIVQWAIDNCDWRTTNIPQPPHP